MNKKYKIEVGFGIYDKPLEDIERVRRSHRVDSPISIVEKWKISFLVITDPHILPESSIFLLAKDLLAIKDVQSVRICKQV